MIGSADTAESARLERLRAAIAKLGADALLVTRPANVRYLSGFTTPADGRVLVSMEQARLITDGRYIAQAQEEARLETDIVRSSAGWLERVTELAAGQRLAVEADHLTLEQFRQLEERLEVVPSKNLVNDLRVIKSAEEAELIRQAARLTDEAFSHILNVLRAGMTEVEVALELEGYLRRAGADGVAFDITVASGYRSAMPHGTASSKTIERGELVTLDYGARLGGYCSDMTRTVALGPVSDEHRRLYDAVLEAQEAALAAVVPGEDGKAIDALARKVLEGYDLAQHFTHGLGHGVGLEIHEAPTLSFRQSHLLEPGMSATIEPGVYLPGDAGVRIEDLLLVTETGFELLSHSPKAFLQL